MNTRKTSNKNIHHNTAFDVPGAKKSTPWSRILYWSTDFAGIAVDASTAVTVSWPFVTSQSINIKVISACTNVNRASERG